MIKRNFRLFVCRLAGMAAACLMPLAAWAQPTSNSPAVPTLRDKIYRDAFGHSRLVVHFAEGTQASAPVFIARHKLELGLSSHDELKPARIFTDQLGQTHYRYQQYHQGIRLAEVELLVHEKNGAVFFAHGEIVPGLQVEISRILTESEALARAMTRLGAQSYMWQNPALEAFIKREQNDPQATFYPQSEVCLTTGGREMKPENFRLAYRLDIYAEKPMGRYQVDVDARTGAVLAVRTRLLTGDVPGRGISAYNGSVPLIIDQITTDSYRLQQAARGQGIETYDMRHRTDYDLAVDFVDADTNFTDSNAAAGVSVHWAAAATYDYYLGEHGRRSYDNADGKLLSYVHYDNGYFNAFWDGTRMTFGDGTNNSTPLTTLDVFGHELTHGVTQFSAGLEYANESGALNESFSDIFGEAVEAFVLGQNDWLIGAEFGAFRSMSNPRAFGDPDTYQGLGWTPPVSNPTDANDWGGVHSNSGVQNHWFYLLSAGGSGINDRNHAFNVTGIGLKQASAIAYRNLNAYLGPNSGYFEARLASIYSTLDLFGEDSPQYRSALNAWDAVGVPYPNLAATVVPSADTLRFLAEAAIVADTTEVTISNLGLADLNVSAIQISGAPFEIASAPELPLAVSFQSSFKVTVAFRPEVAGESAGELTIYSDDPTQPVHTMVLRGKGFVIRPAQAGVIYAVTGRVPAANSNLLIVDQNTGQANSVGPTGFSELTGAALRPATNEIFATIGNSASTTLYRVDAETGEAFAVYGVPVPNLRAIAFDQNDDLYGARFTNGDLFRIDPATADTTFIGATKISLLAGLAFNFAEGALWGVSLNGAIYKIDKATAAVTTIGNAGAGQMADIEFDAEGKLFGLSGFSPTAVSNLLRLYTATGTATAIGATVIRLVTGLTIRGTVPTSVATSTAAVLPATFDLQQNRPNPFNPSTQISYSLPQPSHVKLAVYNTAGQLVRTLVREQKQAAGVYTVQWDGANDAGLTMASSVYFYRLEAGDFVRTKKMMLVR